MRRLPLAFVLLLVATAARADVVRACEAGELSYTRFGIVAALVSVYLVVRYAVAHFERVREAQSAEVLPISLLVAERVARAVQRRSGMIAAVGIAGVPALVVTHVASLAVLSTVIGCIGLRGFFIARSMLQLIEPADPGAAQATASVRGLTVTVQGADGEDSLDVSARALAAACRHAVPTSIAKLR